MPVDTEQQLAVAVLAFAESGRHSLLDVCTRGLDQFYSDLDERVFASDLRGGSGCSPDGQPARRIRRVS
ncbi:hypothetical protein [Nocardia mangyaensis]|uniref:hypothetical protein n=1 Tax=Nocardia mangyaensis TaxID=2213200 RepID=UPI0026768B9C|nr:hypothetical protein [Nocardia mangyaensis]MDO3645493.1 hypothetical protein [Nocardia mangyaensis]